ncbi:tyrosine-type recombinase/integrase [Akkermansia glycaniphila]|uniref:Phage integrase family n=1 Tax=Akkermansia glycaniphila TaxID=1679444 RepID=A0A1C7P9J8_9BACT|nr:site-specific integrase [Akkermansia glycaniphila]OCA02155.1 hypothetical protein AC781_11370 [Akkermansia glycaniphila]SEH99718.1 phage integrase family [Akkermansia glycaniphila]
MASIVQRKRHWYAQFTGEEGKRHTRATGILINPDKKKDGYTPAAAKAKAILIAEEFEASARGERNARKAASRVYEISGSGNDRTTETESPSLSSYIEEYTAKKSGHAKPATIKADERAFNQFMAWAGIYKKAEGGKNCPIDKITKGDAMDFIHQQAKRVTGGTVKRYCASLSALFSDAFDHEIINRNPFLKMEQAKVLRGDPAEKKAFTMQEISLLLEKTPDWVSRLIRCSLYLNGLRLGDTAMLKWNQFDFDRGIFMARQQKTNGIVMFPIREELAAYLQSIRWHETGTYVNPQAVKLMKSFNTGALSLEVNAHIKGVLGTMSAPMQNLSGDRRRVSPKTFHSLRKTAATLMVTSGVPAEVARHLTGHRSNAMLGRYVVPEADTLDEAQHKIPWIA